MVNKFDLVAKDWDLKNTRVEIAMSFVNQIKNSIEIKKDFDILDYGCGTGLISFGFCHSAKSITGMDFSQGMLEEFNKKANEYALKNISCQKHDITYEALPHSSFDLITTSMALHHIKDINDFILKSYDSLRKDGYLAICDLDKEDGSFHSKGNEGVEHFGFDKELLTKTLKKNNFDIIFYENIYTAKEKYPIFCAIAKKS